MGLDITDKFVHAVARRLEPALPFLVVLDRAVPVIEASNGSHNVRARGKAALHRTAPDSGRLVVTADGGQDDVAEIVHEPCPPAAVSVTRRDATRCRIWLYGIKAPLSAARLARRVGIVVGRARHTGLPLRSRPGAGRRSAPKPGGAADNSTTDYASWRRGQAVTIAGVVGLVELVTAIDARRRSAPTATGTVTVTTLGQLRLREKHRAVTSEETAVRFWISKRIAPGVRIGLSTGRAGKRSSTSRGTPPKKLGPAPWDDDYVNPYVPPDPTTLSQQLRDSEAQANSYREQREALEAAAREKLASLREAEARKAAKRNRRRS